MKPMHLLDRTALSPLRQSHYTRDGFQTFDQRTVDSAGAFLIGQLEALDPTIHAPLMGTNWQDDIDLRTDIVEGQKTSSYFMESYAMAGGLTPAGINYASTNQTAIPRIQVDRAHIVNPIVPVAYEVAYSVIDLSASMLIPGYSLETSQLTALNRHSQQQIDQTVYIGDSNRLTNGVPCTGLVNNSYVTNVQTASTAAAGGTTFANKTADEIRADFNTLITSVWAATGFQVPPNKILLAPSDFGVLTGRLVSSAGTETILSFLKRNNVMTLQYGTELEIQPRKFLEKTISGLSSNRMVAYTQDSEYVRFPYIPIRPLATQYIGISIRVPYIGALGQVEVVYPETIGYMDGVG